VPGKIFICGGNDLHHSEHLQLLSFEASQVEEIKMDKPVTSVPCLLGLNVLHY